MGSSDRAFGLVFTAFFAIVAVLPMLRSEPPRPWAFAAAGVLLALALAAPRLLAPLNRLWLKFGDLLHRIVSPIALAILFYGVVTPTGLLMRLFGKDPLRLRFDREAKSYWIAREPPGPPPESLKDQF
jgi:hypothetical protein